MPTPFKASDHTPTYRGKNGGGIDILACVRHGNSTRLGVIEIKDETKPNENIELVINQAVTYACFIRELLRSKSGDKWQLKLLQIQMIEFGGVSLHLDRIHLV